MNKHQANEAARRIAQFWKDRGATVYVQVVRISPQELHPRQHWVVDEWGIRTDMLNGKPRPRKANDLPMIRRRLNLS